MLADKIRVQLQRRLKSRDISPQSLENLAGLNKGAVTNIIYNKSLNPTIETMQSIARALNCSVDDLIRDSESTPTHKEKVSSQDEYLLAIRLFNEVVDCVLKIIETLKTPPNLDQALYIIRESYIYCLTKKKEKVDKGFIDWLIDNKLS